MKVILMFIVVMGSCILCALIENNFLHNEYKAKLIYFVAFVAGTISGLFINSK